MYLILQQIQQERSFNIWSGLENKIFGFYLPGFFVGAVILRVSSG